MIEQQGASRQINRSWHFVRPAVLCLFVFLTGCRLDMLDRQYLYFPEPWDSRDWRALSGLPLEDVWLNARDGTRLFGWYLEAPQSKGTLLWCHGNAGNIIHRLENLRELFKRGLSALLFDYRGYGLSEGQPSEDGLYDDALAAYDYLTKQRRIPSEQIVLFGRSLGAAVAAEVARQNPEAAGLILETPFPSVQAAARTIYGGLPVGALLKSRFELVSRLKDIRLPILVLHGDKDSIIPLALGNAVYEAANNPKQFYRIEGADHNDTYVIGGEPYFQQILRFVRDAVHGNSPRLQ